MKTKFIEVKHKGKLSLGQAMNILSVLEHRVGLGSEILETTIVQSVSVGSSNERERK